MRNINVPVLILHSEDDEIADYSVAKKWSQVIPNCKFIGFKTGGHLMEGNSNKIDEALDDFIT